jgi:putative hydrolase of the HAD superfamily
MTIRAVIWDIGGVLVRTEDREPRMRQAERLGLTREALVYLVFDSEMGQKAQLILSRSFLPETGWMWI